MVATTGSDLRQLSMALLRDDPRLWSRWRADGGSFDSLASRKLFGFVYRFLTRHDLRTDPSFAAARDAYRQAWNRTSLILLRCAAALAALKDAGIDALPLKGCALARPFYGDPGVRPMTDFDILLREDDAARAVAAIAALGWRPMTRLSAAIMPRHDFTLSHDGGGECDLHKRLYPGADAALAGGFFARAVVTDDMPRPSDADLLFHAIVHGSLLGDGDVLWYFDAAAIVRRGAVDWETFDRIAAERRLTHGVRAALDEVASIADLGVPQLTGDPATIPPDLPIRRTTRLGQIRSLVRSAGPRGVVEFIRLMEEDWNAPAWRLPAIAVAKALRRKRDQ